MESENMTIAIRLSGTRPLMFDRYPGDNSTQLPTGERMYLDDNKGLTIPALNVYSLLCAVNTNSVCKMFFGKAGKGIGLGIAGFTMIQDAAIPLLGKDDEQIRFDEFGLEREGAKIYVHRSVARLAKGVPNPKERPVVACPWSVVFKLDYQTNRYCTLENLRQAFDMGGSLGLGTFRPFFGRYELTQFEEVK